MQLQPQLFTLNTLLNGRLFRIPEYQRAYSWEKKQRDDLFADIARVRTSNEDHFMATVVGLKREKKQIIADEFTVVEIVDGRGICRPTGGNKRTAPDLAGYLSHYRQTETSVSGNGKIRGNAQR